VEYFVQESEIELGLVVNASWLLRFENNTPLTARGNLPKRGRKYVIIYKNLIR
jgi:hypothetical protein